MYKKGTNVLKSIFNQYRYTSHPHNVEIIFTLKTTKNHTILLQTIDLYFEG